jgi:hypothetical protein
MYPGQQAVLIPSPDAAKQPAGAAAATRIRSEFRWRSLVAALSCANLCYVQQWAPLSDSAGVYRFWHQVDRRPVDYAAALLGWAILSLFLWPLFECASKGDRSGRVCRFALVWVVCATVYQVQVGLFGGLGTAGRVLLVLPVPVLWLLAPGRKALNAVIAVFLCLSPFSAWTLGNAGFRLLQTPAQDRDLNMAPGSEVRRDVSMSRASGRTRPRVVWVVFDEWDASLTFERRSPTLSMPALDAFRSTSVYAGAAEAPELETSRSIPALLAGVGVVEAHADDAGDYRVKLEDRPTAASLVQLPHIFRWLADGSHRAGAAGWYFPYCDLFGGSLAACYSMPFGNDLRHNGGLASLTARSLELALPIRVRTIFDVAPDSDSHRIVFDRLMNAAVQYVADPQLDFVFLHLPIPHLPIIYDRATGKLGGAAFGLTYDDNLALLDRTVAALEQSIRSTDLWDGTAVLLTSDHWLRSVSHRPEDLRNRVPFLLKLPGQNAPACVGPKFNTVITSKLLMSIMEGSIRTPEQVGFWVNARRNER